MQEIAVNTFSVLIAGIFRHILRPEDGDVAFQRYDCRLLLNYTVLQSRKLYSSKLLL
jgi:hypothetical protein